MRVLRPAGLSGYHLQSMHEHRPSRPVATQVNDWIHYPKLTSALDRREAKTAGPEPAAGVSRASVDRHFHAVGAGRTT
jgi:hypothetical protein